jgi:hypothetical protein
MEEIFSWAMSTTCSHFISSKQWVNLRISLIRIEKSPFSQLRKIKARLALLNKTQRILKKGRQNREQSTKKQKPREKH